MLAAESCEAPGGVGLSDTLVELSPWGHRRLRASLYIRLLEYSRHISSNRFLDVVTTLTLQIARENLVSALLTPWGLPVDPA